MTKAHVSSIRPTRRRFLSMAAVVAGNAVLAACGVEVQIPTATPGISATATPLPVPTRAALVAVNNIATATAATTATIAIAATGVQSTTVPPVMTTTITARAAITTATRPVGNATATNSRPTAPAQISGRAVTLRIARFGNAQTATYEQGLYADFHAQHPEITLQVYPVDTPDWNGYLDQIEGQIRAGRGPDAAYVATEATQALAAQGMATPLDTYVQRDREVLREYFADVAPVLVEAMLYDGHLYELPSDFNAPTLFYNTARFRERGVPVPTGQWTQADFTAAMDKLTERNATPRRYGYAWTNRLFGGALPWFAANGGNLLTQEHFPGGDWLWSTFYPKDAAARGRGGGYRWAQSTANSAANVEALQFLVDLTYRSGAAPVPPAADALQQEVVTLFGSKQLAVFPSGAYSVSQLKNAGIGPGDYDVTPFPRGKYLRPQFGTAGYAMLESSPNKDAVWEFLKYRVRKDVIAATVKGGASTPTRRSLANTQLWTAELGPKHWQVFYDALDTAPEAAPLPAPPLANAITTAFTDAIDRAMNRRETPQAALDRLNSDIAGILSR